MLYVPERPRPSGILSGVRATAPPSTRMRTRNCVSCRPTAGLPMALRGMTMLIVPSALKPLAGSAGVPGLLGKGFGFVPVPTEKVIAPVGFVGDTALDIRTQKSPTGAWRTMGQVVSGGTFCRLTIFRMNMTLPAPSEAGSAIDSFTMSCEGWLSSASPIGSVSTVTPGTLHGSSGGATTHGVGVTALQAGPSPKPLRAVTFYLTDWPAMVMSVNSWVPAATVAILVNVAPPSVLL